MNLLWEVTILTVALSISTKPTYIGPNRTPQRLPIGIIYIFFFQIKYFQTPYSVPA